MNELTVKIVTLLIPGMITTFIIEQGIEHKDWKEYKYTLYIIFWGISSYMVLQCLKWLFSFYFSFERVILDVWDFLDTKIPFYELFGGVIISIVFGCVVLYIEKRNLYFNFLKKVKLSEKKSSYGVMNVFFRELYSKADIVKDYDGYDFSVIIVINNDVYEGVVSSFYENYQEREIELGLKSVLFYKGNEEVFYENLFLCCKKTELKIIYNGDVVYGE